jgi:hypothetical protein
LHLSFNINFEFIKFGFAVIIESLEVNLQA